MLSPTADAGSKKHPGNYGSPAATGESSMSRTPEGDTREQILAAAGRLMARSGIQSFTTRKLAAQAGVNQALIHYHFKSLDALMAELTNSEMRRLSSALTQFQSSDGSSSQSVAETIMSLMRSPEWAERIKMWFELSAAEMNSPDRVHRNERFGHTDLLTTVFQARLSASNHEAGPDDLFTPPELGSIFVMIIMGLWMDSLLRAPSVHEETLRLTERLLVWLISMSSRPAG